MNILKSSLVPAFALLALLLSAPVLRAQDEVRSVQEELRRRSLYFGNVDGRESAELAEATKRYQRRKGFAATGKPDRETLRSLGLLPRTPDEPPPTELNWPAEPVLKSDIKIDPVAVARTLGEETGIAPASVVPDKVTRRRGDLARPRPRPTEDAASARSVSRMSRTNSPFISPENLTGFVGEYLAAMGSNDVKRELKFYADKVNYYHNGTIDRRIIEQTVRRYHARWPNRRYTTGAAISYSRNDKRGEITMIFRVRFTLKDGRQTVSGQTDNRFRISAGTVDPRIISIEEKRVR
ncbi:MAG TPA: peptidoglycan-binding domain-containing protein [Chthoniobacterales bacterium]|nr:peptidoglycan-binding domain-containing protein [Chthoniobacterales bacterium]